MKMDLEDTKTFVGIYFNKDDWQVVPRIWLFEENVRIYTYWPDVGDVGTLARLCTPVQKTWRSYPVQKIVATSEDYKRTEHKVLCGHMSQRQSSEIEVGPRKHKKARLDSSHVSRPRDSDSSDEYHSARIKVSARARIMARRRKQRRYKLPGPLDRRSSSPDLPSFPHPSQLMHLPGKINRKSPEFGQTPSRSLVEEDSPTKAWPSTSNSTLSHRLDILEANQKIILKKLDKILKSTTETNARVKCFRKPQTITVSGKPLPSFDPATTLEELEEILAMENIEEKLRAEEAATTCCTLRSMLKMVMSRTLALQFSFTGMDIKRKKSKISLRDHPLYRILYDTLEQTIHCGFQRSQFDNDLKNILKNAGDWDGHRGGRKKPVSGPQVSGTVPSPSSGVDRLGDLELSALDSMIYKVETSSMIDED